LQPLVLGLTAAALCAGVTLAQTAPAAEIVEACSTCHGEDGNSRTPNMPSLAGQPQFYLLNQLFLFREGVRNIEPMTAMLKQLKDDDLLALAQHFSTLEAKRTDEPIDADLVSRGAALAEPMRCASCHLPTLEGQDQMPRLAKQRLDYLVHALKQFRDNTRSGADTLMSNVVIGVSDADLLALAHYAASR
jgi:cytochrome c553